jgi:hypothetical protein
MNIALERGRSRAFGISVALMISYDLCQLLFMSEPGQEAAGDSRVT